MFKYSPSSHFSMVGKQGAQKAKKSGPVEKTEQKKASLQQQIKDLEEEIASTKYNKSTESAVGILKAKLAMLKERAVTRASVGKGRGDERFAVRKTGDGTVILLGFPSVGKSTLLNTLTGTKSDVAAYAFTTLSAVPGLLQHKHAKIQIVDVPGIVEGAAKGTGRGGEVLTMIRSAEMVLMVVDALQPQQYEAVLREAHNAGIRINQRKPDVSIVKKPRGGLTISSLVPLKRIERHTIDVIAKEFRLNNADILFREDVTPDQFIDVMENNKVYVKGITVITKIDLVDDVARQQLIEQIHPDVIISATTGEGIEELKEVIYQKLDLIRIYLKEVSKKADLEVPLIMFRNSTIRQVCEKLHKDFVKNFKFARLWGKSAKFDGQVFHSMDKHLEDGDILELHVR